MLLWAALPQVHDFHAGMLFRVVFESCFAPSATCAQTVHADACPLALVVFHTDGKRQMGLFVNDEDEELNGFDLALCHQSHFVACLSAVVRRGEFESVALLVYIYKGEPILFYD